jgi:hypothetical protein
VTPVDLFSLVLLGGAVSLGLAAVAGCLLAFGEEHLEVEVDDLAERRG